MLTSSQAAGRGHIVTEHGGVGEAHDGSMAMAVQDGAMVTVSGGRTGVTFTTSSSAAGRGHMTALQLFAREGVGVVQDEVTFTTSSRVAGYGHLVVTQEDLGVLVHEEIRVGVEGVVTSIINNVN